MGVCAGGIRQGKIKNMGPDSLNNVDRPLGYWAPCLLSDSPENDAGT